MTGKINSAADNPNQPVLSALPLDFVKYLEIVVVAVWDIMPCPENLIKKIDINKKIIEEILENKKIFFKQDHSKATYAKKIKKIEGKINWKDSAENILGKINGLYPNPGAWFYFKGERYKILKANISNNFSTPGKVINDNIEISCGKNSIKILEIQREGKKRQNINEFMLGSQIKKGSTI